MIKISDKLQEMAGTSEYHICLELLMGAISNYEETELSRYQRTFNDFVGNERRFTANYCCAIKQELNQCDIPALYDVDVECEFHKFAIDYVESYCGCSDVEVINEFYRLYTAYENATSGELYPDIIMHSPGNMRKQLCYIEIKFEGNGQFYDDFEKLTCFENACQYLKGHVGKDINPVFLFHVFLFINRAIKDKIANAQKINRNRLLKCSRNIICIDKEDDTWHCRTLGEILDELGFTE